MVWRKLLLLETNLLGMMMFVWCLGDNIFMDMVFSETLEMQEKMLQKVNQLYLAIM